MHDDDHRPSGDLYPAHGTVIEPLPESLHVYTRMPRIYVQGHLQRRASALDRRHHTTAIKTLCLSGPAATRPPAAIMLAENGKANVLIAAAPTLYAHAAESELRRPKIFSVILPANSALLQQSSSNRLEYLHGA